MRFVYLLLVCSGLLAQQQQQQRRIVYEAASATGKKVALVIGNSSYPKKQLVNPANDAGDVARALEELGFEVKVFLDLDNRGMVRAVREFTLGLQPGHTALFYYSGHGMQVNGDNYLLPTDFEAAAEFEVPSQAYAAKSVLAGMKERGARVSIIVLDACRDNPYKSWRTGTGGLAAMTGEGVYIAFAAGEGKTADDNPGQRNGLFTKHLLETIKEPGLNIDDVFNRVREKVNRESSGIQTPFSYSGLLGTFYFRAPEPAPQPPPPAPTPVQPAAVPPPNTSNDAMLAAWNMVKDSTRPEVVQKFIDLYPESEYARTARVKLATLEPPKVAPAPVQPDPPLVTVPEAPKVIPQTQTAEVRPPEPKPEPKPDPVPAPKPPPPILPKSGDVRINAKDKLEYILIEPGNSTMGCSDGDTECSQDESPRHVVTITTGFWIGQREVTQGAFSKLMGRNPSRFAGDNFPVEMVTWEDAKNYCQMAGLRLPTEGEWEMAARSGSSSSRYGDLNDAAWHSANSSDSTHPAGEKLANPLGLLDMLGNVWEWVEDWYAPDSYKEGAASDPKGPSRGAEKVLRGGAWDSDARTIRASARGKLAPKLKADSVGFRCAGARLTGN